MLVGLFFGFWVLVVFGSVFFLFAPLTNMQSFHPSHDEPGHTAHMASVLVQKKSPPTVAFTALLIFCLWVFGFPRGGAPFWLRVLLLLGFR